MFSSPFPPHIAFVHVDASLVSLAEAQADLREAELESSAAIRSKERVLQYALGRFAAHRALEQLGQKPSPPVLRGEIRQPLWPQGFCGSITHCQGHAVAAAARLSEARAIGVDLEFVSEKQNLGIARRICLAEEYDWMMSGTSANPVETHRRFFALFSAKETLFKALFPSTGKYFGFQDAKLFWNAGHSSFSATLIADLSPLFPAGSIFDIRCHHQSTYVLTSMSL